MKKMGENLNTKNKEKKLKDFKGISEIDGFYENGVKTDERENIELLSK